MRTVSRVRAAQLAGVDPRTISRWAANGVLVKYRGPRGDVQFDMFAAMKLRKDPDDKQEVSSSRSQPESAAPVEQPRRRRW